jgi:hypothetical protein
MPPVGFEPTISAAERPKTHALDLAATGIGKKRYRHKKQVRLIKTCLTETYSTVRVDKNLTDMV